MRGGGAGTGAVRGGARRGRGPTRKLRIAEAALKVLAGVAWLAAIASGGQTPGRTWALALGGVALYAVGTAVQARAWRRERALRGGPDSKSASD